MVLCKIYRFDLIDYFINVQGGNNNSNGSQ